MKVYIYLSFCILYSATVLVTCNSYNELSSGDVEPVSFYNYTNFSRASKACQKQFDALRTKHVSAYTKMLDSSSKFPYSGIYYANGADFGNYEECISIDVGSGSEKILGKYCAGGFVMPFPSSSGDSLMGALLSYCTPDQCNREDYDIPQDWLPTDMCSTKETNTKLDTAAITTLTITGIIVFLMIVSTLYHLYLDNKGEKPSNPLFTAFSVYNNGKRLFKISKKGGEEVLCFHGIKFISMWWIIAGHGAVGWGQLPVVNAEDMNSWKYKRYTQYIMTAHLAVDSFFYISGFLLAYLYFKSKTSKGSFWEQIKEVPSNIRHRYLRLTPAVLMTFLFTTYVLKFMGKGPVFSSMTTGATCKKYWWTVFLYIQNYYNRNSLCIDTLWYLSVDMQLFIVAPIVIIPVALLYKRNIRVALGALLGCNIFFIVLPIFTKLMWRDYDPDFSQYDTHSRFSDYFIGIMMGLYMRHARKETIKIKLSHNIFFWFLSLAAMFACILITEEVELNDGYVARSLCYSLTRPVWCIGLCWITFACVKGLGGIINWLLSSGFMQIGGKLTYCLYLVHGPIISYHIFSTQTRQYFSDFVLFYLWCGYFIVSLIVALFWTLAFELPFITVEKEVTNIVSNFVSKLWGGNSRENNQS